MLTLEMLEKMLLAAAVELEEKSKMLCELDSVAGDGTMALLLRVWQNP